MPDGWTFMFKTSFVTSPEFSGKHLAENRCFVAVAMQRGED